MWNDDGHLSTLVACNLINGVGFPVAQRVCRQVDDILDQIHKYRSDIFDVIRSGSSAEGFRMRGSDIDKMLVDKYSLVVINQTPFRSFLTLLQMVTQRMRPGYVKLRLLTPYRYKVDIAQVVVQHEGHSVISSFKYRQFYYMICGGEIHGPCVKDVTNTGTEQDTAYCLQCKEWPPDAEEWMSRPRDFEWPSRKLLDRIYSNGCHLMPIGSKTTLDGVNWTVDTIEWRLSFSVAEKDLIYSFNDTQFLVYGIFKLFLHEVIQTEDSIKDCLCSYYMKTLVFWTVEETPQHYWQPERLIFCVDICFQRLISWIINGYCPNYFIRENNMFQGKINEIQQQILLHHLTSFHAEGWRCLLRCRSLNQLRDSLQCVRKDMSRFGYSNFERDFRFISNPHQNISESELQEQKDLRFFSELNAFQAAIPNLQQLKDEFNNAFEIEMTSNIDQFTRDVVTLYRCKIMRHIGLIYFHKAFRNIAHRRTRNRNMYLLIQRGLLLLEYSSNADISRGNLTLATAYFLVENYKKALKYIDCYDFTVEKSCGILCISKFSTESLGLYREIYCTGRLTGVEKASRAVSYDFEVFQKMPCIPKELELEITLVNDTAFILSFPPGVYSVFLKMLCHACQNNIGIVKQLRYSLFRALSNSKWAALYLVYLMIAICEEKIGNLESALKYYGKSYFHKRYLIESLPYCSEKESKDSPLLYSAILLKVIM